MVVVMLPVSTNWSWLLAERRYSVSSGVMSFI